MNDNEIYQEFLRTIHIEAQAVETLSKSIDEDCIIQVIRAIACCKGRIIISGCGTSGTAAKKIVHSLCCIERPAVYLNPCDAVHGALGVLQSEDILILISKGGNTLELVDLIPACKSKGSKLIGVCETSDSTIAKSSDIFLKIKVESEPCRFNMLATASTLAVISTFDAICIALMQLTGYTREQFAVIHPNGAVGEKLQNT